MKTLLGVFALAGLLSLGSQGTLLADDSVAPAQPVNAGKAAFTPEQITDPILDQFLRADQKIREAQIKANQEMFRILDQEGMSVEQYNSIVQAINKDQALLKKVQGKIAAILAEENK